MISNDNGTKSIGSNSVSTTSSSRSIIRISRNSNSTIICSNNISSISSSISSRSSNSKSTKINRINSVSKGPPLWSSGQSFWLQIERSRVRSPALPEFLSSSGSGTGSTQPREVN